MNEYKFKVDDLITALYIQKIEMGYFNFKTVNSTDDGKFEIVLERNAEKSNEIFEEVLKNSVAEVGISQNEMLKLADPKEVKQIKDMEQQGLGYVLNRENDRGAIINALLDEIK